VEALGGASGISKSEVSRICQALDDADLGSWGYKMFKTIENRLVLWLSGQIWASNPG
jgi:hypothetical protein